MQRIDISWIIETFKSIERAVDIQPGIDQFEAWDILFDAKVKVQTIFLESVYGDQLNICRRRADDFIKSVEPILAKLTSEEEMPLHKMDAYRVREAAKSFKLVFLSEMSGIPAFLVTRKENYSTDHLIDNGLGLFPANMVTKAPETLEDAQEAGRCLAYERNTACGFHTFRVVEAVVRRYWDAVAKGKPRPKLETLGKMAAEMNDAKLGDPKVIEALLQLAKLHRNPLAHPDVILTGDEAIGAIGMARSVITHMLAVLPDVPPTTGAP